MNLTSYLQDRQLTVALIGEIDHHRAKEYIQAIAGKIDTYMPIVLILDFREINFMDSSGIAVVMNAIRRMKQLGGKVILQAIGSQPMKVLKAAGMERMIELKG